MKKVKRASFDLVVLLVFLAVSGCSRPAASTLPAGRQPRDPLSGLPFVSAKSWAIADGKTGKILWHYEGNKGRKAASTTKIMCAYVVLEVAGKDPDVLEEIVTASELAANTKGSTAKLKEVSKISVGELLYGLLLPSGNDAGNALGEHFNERFGLPTEDWIKNNPKYANSSRRNFVAEMNRNAKELGMENTIYRIPYGDGGEKTDYTTSACDLLRIAYACMQNQLFRKYVSTREHKGVFTEQDGSNREVLWESTNKLLAVEGFDGIKTGTTKLAGHCLVTSNHRDGDHLLMAVLGSSGKAARHADTQNLYRWAWLERGYKKDK